MPAPVRAVGHALESCGAHATVHVHAACLDIPFGRHRTMDPRRLRLLLELSRRGSMRAVADELGYTTSTVSQQLAVLAREAGTPLIEPDGPAGPAHPRRAAARRPRGDDPRRARGRPRRPRPGGRAGRHRPGRRLRHRDPALALPGRRRARRRRTPPSSCGSTSTSRPRRLALLADDDVDLALVYDYNLAPRASTATSSATPLWTARWSLGVPGRRPRPPARDALAGRPAPLRATPTGSSTPATPPTRRRARPRLARRVRARGSPTAPTASSSCRT